MFVLRVGAGEAGNSEVMLCFDFWFVLHFEWMAQGMDVVIV